MLYFDAVYVQFHEKPCYKHAQSYISHQRYGIFDSVIHLSDNLCG